MSTTVTPNTKRFVQEQVRVQAKSLMWRASWWRHQPAGAFYGWQPFWF